MKNDNKGFSLVEMVVIVGILGIIISIGARNMGLINTYNTRQCKDKMQSAIESVKMDCLTKSRTNLTTTSKADTYMEIVYKNNQVYARTYLPKKTDGKPELVTEELISKGNRTKLKIKMMSPGSYSATPLETYMTDGETMRIAFNRSTGAILPDDGYGGKMLGGFVIEEGKSKREITIQTMTGKIN
ncbi:MAG: hypothetical protein E7294_11150 [Lachnospiraceae bacterium]|jgi:hypothetical protein|nr:hypothetical protein [Lachnospiraceae bacterium]